MPNCNNIYIEINVFRESDSYHSFYVTHEMLLNSKLHTHNSCGQTRRLMSIIRTCLFLINI